MLMVLLKSAAALTLGGAFLGQDVAPPAPSVPTPDVSRGSATVQSQAAGAQASDAQVQQNVGQRTQQSVQGRTNVDAQGRTDLNAPTRANIEAQGRANADAQGRTDINAQGRTNVDAQGRTNVRPLNERQTFQAQEQANVEAQGQQGQQQSDQQGRAALGVSVSDDLTIQQVSPGSPAQRMGLRAGDEILSVNGQTFDSIDGFMQTISSTPHGQQVQIEFDRNGQRMTHSGTLAAWDQVHSNGAQGVQNYSAMRYPSDGMAQGASFDGQQFAGDACCCGGGYSDGGFGYYGGSGYGWGGGYGGYGYGRDNGWSRRSARRAARWGSHW